VSIDVDPVDAHLAGYGLNGVAPDSLVYERAIPRILECLEWHSIRATFFWVARDSTTPLLRQVVAAGHEIASHTLSHPEAWRKLPRADVAHELRVSKERLEQAIGRPVAGFRSPGWHGPHALEQELAAVGYRYDASSFPSPLLGAAGALIWLRSGGRRRTAVGARRWFARRAPHQAAAGVREFPVSVTRAFRIPIYHTLRYALPASRFRGAVARLAAEGHALSYPLHAVDALGLEEDGVDSRLAHHPGMDRPLPEKLALLGDTLGDLARRFTLLPFAERLGAP
jgi:peptidoglycan/xylan/chitin deacetylase (PgdA/CDA1 family)